MNKKPLLIAAVAVLGVASALLAPVANAQTVPTISTTDITTAGLATNAGMQNAATSTYFSNTGETLLVVKGGGTTVTATLKTQATSISQNGYGSATLSDVAVSIPSASVVVMGPFPPARWNNQYGLVGVSMSAVTGVSATAINVPQ
ncbi:hypothetical protein [Rhizobium leguminosarum]|uniref:hypothetical protein n=1 Tax=Rhizobium leguminosarum TaxID=384 RepID=UPI0010325204|nr:hypothetical protein [Rhizobium leguminosarum]MBY5594104.1 hypothetical protein [Rhizobium leguminosarum]MBY5698399.1 hypothetical protein [Rhizobium leguminosarum]TBG41897.1 hypothetical protein ELG77_09000 [Rhizobium leguminosarum]